MNAYNVLIDINLSNLKTKNQFISLMNEKFNFPDYFGFNLDALDECMRDLSWLNHSKIIVSFHNLNKIKNLELQNLIQDCILDYQEYWRHFSNKSLSVLIKLD